MCCAETHSYKTFRKGSIKGKKQIGTWKTTMQNSTLDEEKIQFANISEFERDSKVSNYMENLVPKTCPWAENQKRERCVVSKLNVITDQRRRSQAIRDQYASQFQFWNHPPTDTWWLGATTVIKLGTRGVGSGENCQSFIWLGTLPQL